MDLSPSEHLAETAQTLRAEVAATARLGLPVALGQVAIVGMNLVDTILAGRISAQILAEVAIGTAIWGFCWLFILGVMMAMAPEVAQLRGQDKHDQLASTLNQGLYLALGISAIALPIGFFAPDFMRLAGVKASLIVGASDFVRGIVWGAPALAWYICLQKFCEGQGRTRVTLYFSVLGLMCLMPLAYALMNGAWGAPRWLSFGSGVATALVYWVNALAISVYVWRQFAADHALRVWHAPDWTRLRALAAFGFPIAVTILMEAGLFYVVMLLMSQFGKNWVAAHSVALNVASLAFMLPLGLASAVTVRVGFNFGQQDWPGVRRSAHAGFVLCLVTQACSAAVMVLFAHQIALLYLPNEPEVAALAAGLMGYAALFQFPDGIQVISAGALRGIKDTQWPMLLTSIAYWALGFPLAYVLAFSTQLKARGLWYGFILGLSAAAVMLSLRLWKLIRADYAK